MSERARFFVENWITQYVRADKDEHPLHLFESRADAIACVHSAMAEGISRLELREEYSDLVFHIAAARYRQAATFIPPSA
ncbi:MAG TPA: hypothetical protein VGM68_09755, partial [Rhizomicrobium sp.]